MYRDFCGLIREGGLSTSSPAGWELRVGGRGSRPGAAALTLGWELGSPVHPGQEPDPARSWGQREIELHRAGRGEAVHRDGVGCAAALRVAQPHWQAQSDGEAAGTLS